MRNSFRTILACCTLLLAPHATWAQLEGVIVEPYYEASAADVAASANGDVGAVTTLAPGSKTYRVFLDLAAGYKLETIFGSAAHPLNVSTTTYFYNQTDRGTALGSTNPTARLDENTCSIDSYLSFGYAGTTRIGVLKSADTDPVATIFPNDEGSPVMENVTAWMGTALTAADGMIAGPSLVDATQTIGFTNTNALTGNTAPNNLVSDPVNGSAWFRLGGAQGVDPNGTNRIFIGQFTTNGEFSFALNVRVSPAAGGSFTDYVASNATGAEMVFAALNFPSPDCNGVPGGPALPGTSCDDGNPGTSNDVINASCVCAGTAFQFGAGQILVERIGTGASALGSAASEVLVDEYAPTTAGQAAPVSTYAFPAAAVQPSAAPFNLTESGSATSNGYLSRSSNEQYLAIPGYNATPGTASVAGSNAATIGRTIGLLGADGAVSTPTAINMLSANNYRSIATNGTAFWAAGAMGIVYVANSSATSASSVLSGNIRNVVIHNGVLYYSTGSGTQGIYTLSGLPTGTASSTLIRGVSNPYGFALNPAGTVLYIATDAAYANTASGGGVQRYNWNNGTSTWDFAYTLRMGAANTAGARGLTVDFNAAQPIVYTTTNESSANRLVRIADDGTSVSANAGTNVTILATAGTNKIFRGVAFAPQNCTQTDFYADADGDGSGAGTSVLACTPPFGFVANNTDLCPTDPNKTAPGQCGCGVPDTDTDSDGTANCNDGCPTDANKTGPGACGCGVADIPATYYADTDGDGLGDPNSPQPGFTCVVPPGFVSNNTDLCPAIAGTVGSICNDGNASTTNDVLSASCVCAGTLQTVITGPSSSQSPYLKPQGTGNKTTSILTAGDQIGTYKMVGIPDGLGAFDNGNGTFTLLMNHELQSAGIVRAHGSNGAFVSKWIINKNNLAVQSGADLIQTVKLWNGTSYVNGTRAFARFCSADLPAISAFYNAGTGRGTQERIFMNGEESGNEGPAWGHIVTGAAAGTTYELPRLGKFSWENSVACPVGQDKTVVAGTDDSTPGQVYIYIGTKQTTGSDVDKAGLTNGNLYGIKVAGLPTELSSSFPAPNTAFTLFNLGNVENISGNTLNNNSNTAQITNFLRPEDAAWDPTHPEDLYFVTTNALTSPSRMWRIHFTDILHPELGGTITAVLDGTEGQKMMDNITVDQMSHAYIVEDVGNNAHIGRMLQYNITTDQMTTVAYHDSTRFLIGGANFLTQDEEASGVIDVQDILGKGKYLVDVQAHYGTTTEVVEGGQLLQFSTGDTVTACVAASITAITGATTICSLESLALNGAASGTLPLSYSWSGTGTFANGSTNPSAIVNGAATGNYTLTVTNACGSDAEAVVVTVDPALTYYADADGDNFGDPAVSQVACTQPGGYVANNTDGCPADATKQAPGVCGCGVPDTDTDGDGTANCNDGCPTDPNKIAPGACGCGIADVDGDGDGTSDCNDSCPNVTGQIGSPCNDGNACTINDVLNAGCQCAGTPDNTDTDGDGIPNCSDTCPLVTGQIGSGCDDGDANTTGDVLNASCQCAGTPIAVVCQQNEVILALTTDADGTQTSYDIVNTGTTTAVCSGSGLASSSTITVTCCLPNGCYDLRVFDTFGDGINPGGYVLRDANNKRIIDNQDNGNTFTVSSISPLGFCVPLGADALKATSCDVLNATSNTVLAAEVNGAVSAAFITGHPNNANSGYQFWVTNPNGGFSRRILFTHAAPGTGWPAGTPNNQKASYFRLSAMSSAPVIPQGVLLNVRVRTLVNSVYGAYGPVCRLLLPVPPCQPSQLTTTADPLVSCGATGLSLTSTIYAITVPGATAYQFEFSKAGYLRRITSATRAQALNFITSPLQYNNCYEVRVRVTTDGGLTYCPFGSACTITIGTAICGGGAMAPQADGNADVAISEASLRMWPNPNNGEQLFLSIAELGAEVTTTSVDIYDLNGQRVIARTIPVQDNNLNTVITLDQQLAPGMYMVIVAAGEASFTQRLVIQ